MSKEYYCPFTRVVISVRTRLFGEVSATIRCKPDLQPDLSQCVTRVRIDFTAGPMRGRYIDIPAKALKDAGPVLMSSWEFVDDEPRRTTGRHLYLVVRAPGDKTIRFGITDGVFARLAIGVAVADGAKWDTVNY